MFRSRIVIAKDEFQTVKDQDLMNDHCSETSSSSKLLEAYRVTFGRTSRTARRDEMDSSGDGLNTLNFDVVDSSKSSSCLMPTNSDFGTESFSVTDIEEKKFDISRFYEEVCKRPQHFNYLPHPSELTPKNNKKRRRRENRPPTWRKIGSVEEHLQQIKERSAGCEGYANDRYIKALEESQKVHFPTYAQASRDDANSSISIDQEMVQTHPERRVAESFLNPFLTVRDIDNKRSPTN